MRWIFSLAVAAMLGLAWGCERDEPVRRVVIEPAVTPTMDELGPLAPATPTTTSPALAGPQAQGALLTPEERRAAGLSTGRQSSVTSPAESPTRHLPPGGLIAPPAPDDGRSSQPPRGDPGKPKYVGDPNR